ncbi:unnamed protein product [Meloidogyne enterolobii]|uniref:Uncharacterized protein n=1 Tax=Meloidogyne enterolobii TaxID=390850 RepID=A0ACB0XN42_MELEN
MLGNSIKSICEKFGDFRFIIGNFINTQPKMCLSHYLCCSLRTTSATSIFPNGFSSFSTSLFHLFNTIFAPFHRSTQTNISRD